MSEQQLLSERLAIELEKVKSDCPEFSYDLIGKTEKSSKRNAYKLMFNGKKIGEVWPRGKYGHLYTNILTEEEKNKVIKVQGVREYIPGPENDTDYYNFHEGFILKWNREFKSFNSVSNEVKDLIKKSKGCSLISTGNSVLESTPENTILVKNSMKLPQNVILKNRKNALAFLIAICDNMNLDEAQSLPYESQMSRYSQLKNMGRITSIAFHPQYQYEDFMEKVIHIIDDNDGMERDVLKDGDFKKFCTMDLKLAENKQNSYSLDVTFPRVFFISDMDNSNVCSIFGEIMDLLPDIEECSKGVIRDTVLPYSGELFEIPKNVHIVGIMNSPNKLDYKTLKILKRKFQFV